MRSPSRSPSLSASLSARETAGILVLAAAGLAALLWLPHTAAWARLIAPFDRPPAVSALEILTDPAKARAVRAEQCAWAEREALRHPGPMSRAAVESACR